MKTTEMTTEKITDLLNDLSDSQLVSIWNEYQDKINGSDQVFDFDDYFFDNYFSTPMEAARATYMGKIQSWSDKYIIFNGYGNLESSSNLDVLIDLYDLANYIEENQDQYEDLLAE